MLPLRLFKIKSDRILARLSQLGHIASTKPFRFSREGGARLGGWSPWRGLSSQARTRPAELPCSSQVLDSMHKPRIFKVSLKGMSAFRYQVARGAYFYGSFQIFSCRNRNTGVGFWDYRR